ncbi:aldehyde dehydrogenase [Pseudomonas gingeri]|uniref:Aldehyde dehydrogenase n=1 Tax=Pseudomonas gingeri TaxID=117681 RepID=A0A7Y7YAU6_9PSED|nr:aldehyde dehydrogenase [Pseudomonas gingeri]NVZ99134.1 aldehyde dehydrogenase [Pseudomonas gingeri]NWA13179.1 aldehyde dehydrogenase [Pseudomonas gingeri]NWA55440.1 aldehyde dehydrogenase [Pseudomonas gingeri]NWA95706.1 aldehyde dehydrogenase [Pseudomonas gingeri]NWB00794.1 aldehyde dehydrogenase [Pseudomonas gingeri]
MNESLDTSYYHRIAASLTLPDRPYINGQYVQGDARYDNINPATGQVFGSIGFANRGHVDQAVAAGRAVFETGDWSRAKPEFRKTVLLRLAGLIREHSTELAVMESLDSGKPIKDCLHEIGTEVPNFFQWYAELIDKTFGKVVPTGEDVTAFIVQEPIGVVGAIVPWNFPLLMSAWKLAPALAAGCSVVLKPAELTSLTALRLAELATRAGLPDGVLNVLPGYGQEVGEAMGRHPGIDAITFTGSGPVGALILEYAAQSNLKPVGLELGGKSPLIILDDAPLSDDLIDNAVNAAFWNAGQNCSANMRQIVHSSCKAQFLEKVKAKVASLKVGDPLDPETDIGPLVSARQRDRVQGFIDKGIEQGAKVLTGNRALDLPGFYLDPVVFDGVDAQMVIAREEIFGPVLGVIEVHSDAEALQVARDTEYGLHASVFTRDIDRALHFARQLPCGVVGINGFSEGDVKTPFGGYRKSGSLSRDKGTEAMSQYLQTKTVWIRSLRGFD